MARTCHDHYVVNNVRASTVTSEEDTASVAVLRKPWIGTRRSPNKSCAGVVVGRGNRVLRGKAVVDRHGENISLGDDRVDVPVVHRRGGRVDDQASAVEVHEDGQLLVLGGGEVIRDVEACRDVSGAVDDDVLGGDPRVGVKARRCGVRAEEALYTTLESDRSVVAGFMARWCRSKDYGQVGSFLSPPTLQSEANTASVSSNQKSFSNFRLGHCGRSGHSRASATHSAFSEERDQPAHERHGRTATGLAEEEDVLLALGLEPLHCAAPPARCEALVVCSAPRPQEVHLRRADEHPLARQVSQAPRHGGPGVRSRVVGTVRSFGAHDEPQLLHLRHRLRRLPVDGIRAPDPVEQNRALDPRRHVVQACALLTGHHRDVVDDAPAGAVAGQEDAAEVAVLRQPGVSSATRDHPLERPEGVLVPDRQRVLGREAVVHGDDE
ncbi:hypothetical protein EJB05_43363, partial [Eragrostis curvula]